MRLKPHQAEIRAKKTHRHGQLSNAIEQHDKGCKEAEACNLLAVIGADGVDVGAQEEGGSHQGHNDHLQRLGLVHHNGALDQRELTPHQCLDPLQHCSVHHTQLCQSPSFQTVRPLLESTVDEFEQANKHNW